MINKLDNNMSNTDNNDKIDQEVAPNSSEDQQEINTEAVNTEQNNEENNQNTFDTSWIVWSPGHKNLISKYIATVCKAVGTMHVLDNNMQFTPQEATRLFLLDNEGFDEEDIKNKGKKFSDGVSIASFFFLIRSIKDNYDEFQKTVVDALAAEHNLANNIDYKISSSWNAKSLDQTYLISGIDLGRAVVQYLDKLKKYNR